MIAETKEIILPSGLVIKIKTWITAREARELREITLKHTKVIMEQVAEVDGTLVPKPTIKDYDILAVSRETEEKTIELVIKEYVGSMEKILERLLDGTDEDYQFALKEAQKIVGNLVGAK